MTRIIFVLYSDNYVFGRAGLSPTFGVGLCPQEMTGSGVAALARKLGLQHVPAISRAPLRPLDK